MANALITPTMIVNEGIRILVNESAFLGLINTQYNDSFAKRGAKVGNTINIRVPTQYTVRSGPVANLQDVTEQTIPLTVQPEIGVDWSFSDYDLALTIDDFSDRYLKPAMVNTSPVRSRSPLAVQPFVTRVPVRPAGLSVAPLLMMPWLAPFTSGVPPCGPTVCTGTFGLAAQSKPSATPIEPILYCSPINCWLLKPRLSADRNDDSEAGPTAMRRFV